MELALIILASASLIAVAELLKRKLALSTAFTRKFAHVTTALVACVAPLFVTRVEIIIVSLIFAVALFCGRWSRLFSAIHSVDRKTFGDVFLPLGVAGAAFFFLPHDIHAFQFGILVMGVSDALAGFVGERFGKHSVEIFGNKKSMEGSAAFSLSALVIGAFFIPTTLSLICVTAILTLTEFFAVYGLDNLILPTLAGFMLQIFI